MDKKTLELERSESKHKYPIRTLVRQEKERMPRYRENGIQLRKRKYFWRRMSKYNRLKRFQRGWYIPFYFDILFRTETGRIMTSMWQSYVDSIELIDRMLNRTDKECDHARRCKVMTHLMEKLREHWIECIDVNNKYKHNNKGWEERYNTFKEDIKKHQDWPDAIVDEEALFDI